VNTLMSQANSRARGRIPAGRVTSPPGENPRDCPAAVGRRDHIVEATLTGTAIVRFSAAGRPAGVPLAVMSLGPRQPSPVQVFGG